MLTQCICNYVRIHVCIYVHVITKENLTQQKALKSGKQLQFLQKKKCFGSTDYFI